MVRLDPHRGALGQPQGGRGGRVHQHLLLGRDLAQHRDEGGSALLELDLLVAQQVQGVALGRRAPHGRWAPGGEGRVVLVVDLVHAGGLHRVLVAQQRRAVEAVPRAVIVLRAGVLLVRGALGDRRDPLGAALAVGLEERHAGQALLLGPGVEDRLGGGLGPGGQRVGGQLERLVDLADVPGEEARLLRDVEVDVDLALALPQRIHRRDPQRCGALVRC